MGLGIWDPRSVKNFSRIQIQGKEKKEMKRIETSQLWYKISKVSTNTIKPPTPPPPVRIAGIFCFVPYCRLHFFCQGRGWRQSVRRPAHVRLRHDAGAATQRAAQTSQEEGHRPDQRQRRRHCSPHCRHATGRQGSSVADLETHWIRIPRWNSWAAYLAEVSGHKLEFLSGFLRSFFHSTEFCSWIDSGFLVSRIFYTRVEYDFL